MFSCVGQVLVQEVRLVVSKYEVLRWLVDPTSESVPNLDFQAMAGEPIRTEPAKHKHWHVCPAAHRSHCEGPPEAWMKSCKDSRLPRRVDSCRPRRRPCSSWIRLSGRSTWHACLWNMCLQCLNYGLRMHGLLSRINGLPSRINGFLSRINGSLSTGFHRTFHRTLF